jgi:hypothetical protein
MSAKSPPARAIIIGIVISTVWLQPGLHFQAWGNSQSSKREHFSVNYPTIGTAIVPSIF